MSEERPLRSGDVRRQGACVYLVIMNNSCDAYRTVWLSGAGDTLINDSATGPYLSSLSAREDDSFICNISAILHEFRKEALKCT